MQIEWTGFPPYVVCTHTTETWPPGARDSATVGSSELLSALCHGHRREMKVTVQREHCRWEDTSQGSRPQCFKINRQAEHILGIQRRTLRCGGEDSEGQFHGLNRR